MRIGILTLPLHTNYGGILQAYALQTVLERMGHEVVILDKGQHRHLPLWKMPYSYPKRIFKKYILGKKSERIFFEYWYNRTYPIVSQHTQKFINTYMHVELVANLNLLNEKDFDAIVVGSDQIWRVYYYPQIENGFLAFAKDWKHVKRIAYAPSFGIDEWEYSEEQTRKCRQLVQKFDAVSVREVSGVKLCREHLGVEAKHVLDPTMLLDKEDYLYLISRAEVVRHSNTLLQYVLDKNEEIRVLIQAVAQDKHLDVVCANSKVEDYTASLDERIQPPVEQWLAGFCDADFVVTDSFHACVFSIIFNKPFIVIGNKKRGYIRFQSLLSMFGLSNRLVTTKDEALVAMRESIDWEMVNKKRSELREQSIDYLQSSLN